MTCPRKRDMTFDSEAICPSRRADAPGAGPWGPAIVYPRPAA